MSDANALGRRYRRLLASYPPSFRREHEEEMVAVLLEASAHGGRISSLAEAAYLVAHGVWTRVRQAATRGERAPRAAVTLMYVGAAVELCTLITIVATVGNLRSAILHHNPNFTVAEWHAEVHGRIVPLEVNAVIAVGVWLWMAWANGRGYRWARVVFAAFFAMTTVSLLRGVASDAATFAPADLLAGIVLWCVSLAALVLVFGRQSSLNRESGRTGGA